MPGKPLPFARLQERLPLPVMLANSGAHVEVDLARMTSVVGFSFDPHGEHPHVRTCAQHLDGVAVRAEDTPLARLYARYRPQTATETLPLAAGVSMGPLDDLPPHSHIGKNVWSLTRVGLALVRTSRASARGGTYFGPVSGTFLERELDRTVAVLSRMADEGYQPARHTNGYVTGYLLVDDAGDYRFVVRDGNHRVAALAALGVKTLEVGLMLGHPPVIHERDLAFWSTGRRGLYPLDSLQRLFDGFFSCSADRRLGPHRDDGDLR